MSYFAGIDIGASSTKAIIINEAREVTGHAVVHSGADFEGAAAAAFEQARAMAGGDSIGNCEIVATGYGRRNVPAARETRTEISCHASGSYHHHPHAHTLIDIGGQDSKVVKVDDAGKRVGFKMNRKCAAGTGAFLEEIAARLKLELGALNGLAESAGNDIQIGSYCTVFTATEILARIREGVAVADIVKGIFNSVIKRVLEMDSLDGKVVMSGGVVAYNPYLVKMFEHRTGKEIFVPPHPQLTGAFGAALYSLENKDKGGPNA
ncbi:MAG: ATPase [Candidatus Zixiibacteriota bacterium]|nr:MAG: ATPase [candidate division Zixibacteria bacterium]